ncbi:MAG: DoxX family protein [Microcystaceae cyanobacterium]
MRYIPLLARILLSAIFLKAAINKILNPAATQQVMEAQGIPGAGLLLIVTIVVLLVGGISVLLGYKARLGALLLIGFLIPTTLIFHTDFPEQETNFLKNLGLMGGLLMVTAFGPGSVGFDKPVVSISKTASQLKEKERI